jgi:hypothetical protein
MLHEIYPYFPCVEIMKLTTYLYPPMVSVSMVYTSKWSPSMVFCSHKLFVEMHVYFACIVNMPHMPSTPPFFNIMLRNRKSHVLSIVKKPNTSKHDTYIHKT